MNKISVERILLSILMEQVKAKELVGKYRHRLSIEVDDTAKAVHILKDKLSCSEYQIQNGKFMPKNMWTHRAHLMKYW